MPKDDHQTLAPLPLPIEHAYGSINRQYADQQALLQANVAAFESLPQIAFAYFNRDDVFYVNKAGRDLLSIADSPFETKASHQPPIFWLEDDQSFRTADRIVIGRGQGLVNTRELVTLSWGKTWMEGVKLPILSLQNRPIAVLFIGGQLEPAAQIRNIAQQFELIPSEFGEN